MKDIIKAMLLIAFSVSLLIYDQQSYEATKKEELKETRMNAKKPFNPLVQDYQIKFTKPDYDSVSAKLFDHKFFQATKSDVKKIEY